MLPHSWFLRGQSQGGFPVHNHFMTMSNETRLSTFRLVTTATNQKVVWGKGSVSCHHRPPRNLGLYMYYVIKVSPRMASSLTLQISSQGNGTHGNYLISKQLHRNMAGFCTLLLTCCSDIETKQDVIIKNHPRFPLP
jgi:hypothetical protein